MTPPYLLVFAHQRSGSNYLLDLLRSFTGVVTLGEFFNVKADAPGKRFRTEALEQYDGSIPRFREAAERDPVSTLDFLRDRPDIDLVVLKVFGHQLKSQSARRALTDNAIGVIHLRRNAFATWVSRQLARESGHWFNESSASRQVSYDSDDFLRFARQITEYDVEFDRVIRDSLRPAVSLTYQELTSFSDPRDLWSTLRQSIPLLPQLQSRPDWTPLISRQDSRKPIDRVSNPSVARNDLRARGLEHLLDDTDTDDPSELLRLLGVRPHGTVLSAIRERLRRLIG